MADENRKEIALHRDVTDLFTNLLSRTGVLCYQHLIENKTRKSRLITPKHGAQCRYSFSLLPFCCVHVLLAVQKFDFLEGSMLMKEESKYYITRNGGRFVITDGISKLPRLCAGC